MYTKLVTRYDGKRQLGSSMADNIEIASYIKW